MIVDPAIAALRSDPASQRRLRKLAKDRYSDWCGQAEVAIVLRELVRYADGDSLGRLQHLSELMWSPQIAQFLVNEWCVHFGALIRENPLVQIPMRHHHSEGFTSMQLASAGGAALSLSTYAEQKQVTNAASVVFADRDMHDLVLHGDGEAIQYALCDTDGRVQIDQTRRMLEPGSGLETIGDRQSRRYTLVRGRLLVLQLSRVPQSPGLNREYALDTGELLLQSSGDKRSSQQEMAIAVLSAMGRADAAPNIAAMAQDGPDHLRWEAVRHALALDAAAGVEALETILMDEADPLNAPAKELRAQLQANYPQLFAREAA